MGYRSTGNSGGKKGRSGRKPKSVERGLLQILDKAWPEHKRIKFFEMLAARVDEGDIEAGKYLVTYVYGKPQESHNVEGVLAVKVMYGKRNDQ